MGSHAALGPLTDAQQDKVTLPSQRWDDDFALKIAKRDFEDSEVWRSNSLDFRWQNADQLYLAWVQQRFWEGTRIPRANIGIYTAFEQIESMVPKILQSIFADYPNWFQTEARPGTTTDMARAVSNLVIAQMENMGQHRIATVREVMRRCLKSAGIYGNGPAELCWLQKEETRFVTFREYYPERQDITHPILGRQTVSTGRQLSRIRQIPRVEKTNQPFLRYISIKDFYVDPNCAGPQVSDGRFCAVRKLMTVDEILSYKKSFGFNIPDTGYLVELSKKKIVAQGDNTKQMADMYRQMWWTPQNDTTADPGGKRLEVVAYHTPERLVWMANREAVLYNQPHPFGFMPFYDLFYCDVLDRFYGLAITDVVEPEQRLQQTIINARIDELALNINKRMVKRRGVSIPAYQLKTRPGQVIETDNPREDIVYDVPPNQAQDAYIEVQASDNRVQKITGGSDLALLGTPSSGGNSANRTATGVGAQVQATGSRVQYQVENAEDTVIEQMLSDWLTITQRFIERDQIIDMIGPDGQQLQVDPLTIINSRVKFAMRASAKMAARQGLLQVFPLIMQSLSNPGLLAELRTAGMTVNWTELESMVFDACGYRNKTSLFRKLTPEEAQQANQPPIQEMIRMQMQQERIAGQKDIAEDKQLADMVRELIKSAVDHHRGSAETDQQAMHDIQNLIVDRAMQHQTAVTTAQMGQQPTEPQEVNAE
jgi:hypothetical protein